VSFEVKQGEVLGIIGRNGAGKSTLLKILSRVTGPTSGEVRVKGRIASLLEVGTGFNPELTGRENIFLNGAILGMTKAEIRGKFDEIVDFSGVETFIDTPVKRYSSGMTVRLAFAVAAHLEPEILIVDEVLAVGDAEFQKKCLGKMHDVAGQGRTILFVSHNMQAVSVLCSAGILLDRGKTAYAGSANGAIDAHLSASSMSEVCENNPDHRPGSGTYRFTLAHPTRQLFGGAEEKSVVFEIMRRKLGLDKMWFSAHLVDAKGLVLMQCDSRLVGVWVREADRLTGTFRFKTPWLKPGCYSLDLFLCSNGIVDHWENACTITISPLIPYRNSISADGVARGLVFGDFAWEMSTPQQTLGNHETPSGK
jgi:lipopolysaccharide transport system ATP-binding protein